ncbi:MAG: NAD kinase [Bacteroidetes bacterium]|nr:NAD kinase [Bacteroidota bacterium]
MKLAIFGKEYNEQKKDIFLDFFRYLDAHKTIEYTIYEPFLKKISHKISFLENASTFNHPDEIKGIDFLCSLGGDGTILESLLMVQTGTPIIGINTGRLGFLSSITSPDTISSIESILNGDYFIDERSMVKVITNDKLFGETNYALNEITIHKKDSSSMIIVHAYIDDEYLASYWADGLIISTPTGSTGYSLSCNGPIVMPQSGVFIITPIAPHNLNVRPLIIPNTKKIKLKMEGRGNEFLISLDSRNYSVDEKTELIIEKEEFKANIVRIKGHSFANTLRNKLNWGLDTRN